MKKRVLSTISLILVIVMAISGCAFAAIEYVTQNKFPDIAWYETDSFGNRKLVEYYVREITQAANIGFIEGYPDGYFRPLNSISREEFVKMLIMLATNAAVRAHDTTLCFLMLIPS